MKRELKNFAMFVLAEATLLITVAAGKVPEVPIIDGTPEVAVYAPIDLHAHHARLAQKKAAMLEEPVPDEEELPDETYQYSEQEKKLIARVVYAEARGERWEGKVAVAQVVINRFESGRFGKTVRKVVFAKHQFAVSSKYNDECMRAVEAAINERSYPHNMYYFQVSRKKKWKNFVYFGRIGNHSFYCSKMRP